MYDKFDFQVVFFLLVYLIIFWALGQEFLVSPLLAVHRGNQRHDVLPRLHLRGPQCLSQGLGRGQGEQPITYYI